MKGWNRWLATEHVAQGRKGQPTLREWWRNSTDNMKYEWCWRTEGHDPNGDVNNDDGVGT